MKNKRSVGKKAGDVLVASMLVVSILTVFSTPALAQNENKMGIIVTDTCVEVGDTFSAIVWFDPYDGQALDSCSVDHLWYNWTSVGLANITTHEIYGFWHTGFDTNGTVRNDWGELHDAQSFSMLATTANYTLLYLNFTAINPGLLYLNLTGRCAVGGHFKNLTFYNDIVRISPQDPAAIGATAFNATQINVTFTPGVGDDAVVICGNDVSYPANPQTDVLYNGSTSPYIHTGLNPCTTYYYRAWGYNSTSGTFSCTYRQTFEKTVCLSNFTFQGENPIDGAIGQTGTNYNYRIPVNVTVINSAGHSYRWWINTTLPSYNWHGTGRPANLSTPVQIMRCTLHNHLYWWNVTVVDSGGDWAYGNYSFTTGQGGGTAPSVPTTPSPADDEINISANLNLMSCVVTDPDGDPIETSFYWLNGTLIGTDATTPSGGTASITPGLNLNYATTYRWYAELSDGYLNRTGPTWDFTTQASGLSITKEAIISQTPWGQNGVIYFVNLSNTGGVNLTNVYVNETYDTDITYYDANPSPDTGNNQWVIPYLNTTGYANDTWNLVIWCLLNNNTANGSTVTNTVIAENVLGGGSASITPLTLCISATKETNLSTLEWNTSYVQYYINVTNCGDFILHGVLVNETWDANMTFVSASYPNVGDTFQLGDILVGQTKHLVINVTTSYLNTGEKLINETRHYNNITVKANETSEVSVDSYLFTGAVTESIKVIYIAPLTNVEGIGNSVFNILGIILIIGSILLIVGIVYKSGFLGGGE